MSTAQRQAPAKQARLDPARVHLFTADTYDVGTPNEETWTEADLDDVARNHRLLYPALWEPPVGIGHSSDAALAYATVVRVWREGRHLWGSYGEVSPELEGLLRGRYLRAPSVELYRCPTQGNFKIDQVPGLRGAVLRRVVYLGAWPPRVKGLAKPKFAPAAQAWAAGEAARLYCARPGWTCAEASMSDDQNRLREVAEKAGFGASFLDSLDDGQLGLMIADLHDRVLSGGQSSDTGTDTAADTTGADAGADDMPAPSREQMIQDLVAAGQDQAALEQMDEAALTELWKQTQGQGGGTAAAPSTYGERDQRRGRQADRPIQLSMRTLDQLVVGRVRSEVAKVAAPSTKRRISEFCERMVGIRRLSPAQVEVDEKGRTIGPIRRRLERASSVVSCFGEHAGKSELELQMEEIEAGPELWVAGERLADGPGGVVGTGGADAAFEERLKKHYEARNARLDRRA